MAQSEFVALFGPDQRMYFGTAAPTAGTYQVGDICWNTAPSANEPSFWRCSVAGTPGTWIAAGHTNTGTNGQLLVGQTGADPLWRTPSGDGTLTAAGVLAITGFAGDVLAATDKKVQFRDTGIFLQSGADGKLTISADGVGADDITLAGTVAISDSVLVDTDKKIQLRDTGVFIQSDADGKLKISADGAFTDDITLTGTVKFDHVATFASDAGVNLGSFGWTMAAIARTATVDGTTTGTIASGPSFQFISVTASDPNHIIILPTPTPGSVVLLHVAANGFELRTSDPNTIGINGGTGAAAESAIGANTTVLMICASATSWKGLQMGADGTLAKVEVAA